MMTIVSKRKTSNEIMIASSTSSLEAPCICLDIESAVLLEADISS